MNSLEVVHCSSGVSHQNENLANFHGRPWKPADRKGKCRGEVGYGIGIAKSLPSSKMWYNRKNTHRSTMKFHQANSFTIWGQTLVRKLRFFFSILSYGLLRRFFLLKKLVMGMNTLFQKGFLVLTDRNTHGKPVYGLKSTNFFLNFQLQPKNPKKRLLWA